MPIDPMAGYIGSLPRSTEPKIIRTCRHSLFETRNISYAGAEHRDILRAILVGHGKSRPASKRSPAPRNSAVVPLAADCPSCPRPEPIARFRLIALANFCPRAWSEWLNQAIVIR